MVFGSASTGFFTFSFDFPVLGIRTAGTVLSVTITVSFFMTSVFDVSLLGMTASVSAGVIFDSDFLTSGV